MPNISERHLGVPDVNNLIELLIGDDTPVRAVEQADGIYLVGAGEDVKLSPEDLTRSEILKLLYDFAVHFGYTNDDFDEFVGA